MSDSRPLYAGRRPPSHQAPGGLVPEEIHAPGFDDACFLTTRLRRVHCHSSFGHSPAQGPALSFWSNAHHHAFWTQQLGVVRDPLLKADPEGPALIICAALRHDFRRSCRTPFHVSAAHCSPGNRSQGAFVTRLQPGGLQPGQSPGQTARQLPDQSTTLWVESSSTGETRLRSAQNKYGTVSWRRPASGVGWFSTSGTCQYLRRDPGCACRPGGEKGSLALLHREGQRGV